MIDAGKNLPPQPGQMTVFLSMVSEIQESFGRKKGEGDGWNQKGTKRTTKDEKRTERKMTGQILFRFYLNNRNSR